MYLQHVSIKINQEHIRMAKFTNTIYNIRMRERENEFVYTFLTQHYVCESEPTK